MYAGLYGPAARELQPDCVADPVPWLRALAGSGPVWLLGPGADLYRNEIQSVLGAGASIVPGDLGMPRAVEVAVLGERLARAGASRCPSDLKLRYLRAPEAVEKSLDRARENP